MTQDTEPDMLPEISSPSTSEIVLTDEQKSVVDRALQYLDAPNSYAFRIGGYAGTGKTTIAKYIIREFRTMGVCAYTGKAVSQLRKKGVGYASTIHSMIYSYDPDVDDFFLISKDQLSEEEYPYFLIDEGSMVGRDLFEDLLSFHRPIIVIGDPGQLEPVGSTDINLMKNPDAVLEKIHRQAEDSPIIQLATNIRLGQRYELQSGPATVKTRARYDDGPLWPDVHICGRNVTRHRLNQNVREAKGFKDILCVGETIIFLKNNKNLGVFNGMTTKVLRVENYEGYSRVEVQTVEDLPARWIKVTHEYLGKDRADAEQFKSDQNKKFGNRDSKTVAYIDYGYAMTCHKSQGSEWDKVVIHNEKGLWDQKRWLYTAVTRAAKELQLLM